MFSKAIKCRAAALSADTVIAGSTVIAEWANAYNSNVVLIPSCVDPGKYNAKQDWSVNEPPRVVWLGSPSTEQYLVSITAPLLEIRRRLGARLIVISAGSATLGPLDAMTTRVPWSEDLVGRILATGDVAVAPLIDTPYARGKCAYKVLQYAAAGLPVVGSPVGSNARALDRLGGTQAHSQSDWVDALFHILTAPQSERAEAGTRARSGVDQHYSFRAWEGRWLEAVGINSRGLAGPGGSRG
jgi:glycosyltransferase involved in cell wall biosynthesis